MFANNYVNHEKDPGASYEANVRLPLFLAKAAKEQKLICFSSDLFFAHTSHGRCRNRIIQILHQTIAHKTMSTCD